MDINNIINDEKIKEIEVFGRSNNYPILLGDSCYELLSLIQNEQPKNILEIGTCIGYSGTLMLKTLQQAKLTTIEINEQSASIAKANFDELGLSNRVQILIGDAKDLIKQLNEKYDFIFLDGPKAQYKTYLPFLIDLLNIGGIIFADNVYFKGFVMQDESAFIPAGIRSIVKNLRLYLKLVKQDARLQVNVKDIGDGICIAKKVKER